MNRRFKNQAGPVSNLMTLDKNRFGNVTVCLRTFSRVNIMRGMWTSHWLVWYYILCASWAVWSYLTCADSYTWTVYETFYRIHDVCLIRHCNTKSQVRRWNCCWCKLNSARGQSVFCRRLSDTISDNTNFFEWDRRCRKTVNCFIHTLSEASR
jgi:hypothetical protein